MTLLHRLAAMLRWLLRRDRAERDLDDELRAFVDMAAADEMRDGVSATEARRRALIHLGGLEQAREQVRTYRHGGGLDEAGRDVRHALRAFVRHPGFTGVVVLTLALGIGATAAIFSAVNAVMLRTLPVDRPDELISLTALYPSGAEPFSYAAYRRLAADGAAVVDALAASPARREAIALDGPPEVVDLKWVSGNYFTTLGVPARIGRPLFPPDDPGPPGTAVAVISDAFWARRFGRDPTVVGRGFRLDGAAFVIVGVARGGFVSESPGESTDFWLPLSARPNAPSWVWEGHSTTWLSLLARRRPGVSLAQARAGLEPVYEGVREDVAGGTDSAEFRRSVLESRLQVGAASGGISRLRDRLQTPLLILMGIVGLVLLVACANVASLMLTRAVARRREIALSLALGAGRARVIRHGMVEALLLAALGGLGGCAVALWGTSALTSLLSGVLPVVLDISPDSNVLVFVGAISCAAAVLSGLLPTLTATRLDPLAVLRSGGSGGRGASRLPFGRTLVVAQIAVSLVLLVAAGSFVRSLLRLQQVDLGFDPNQVVLVRVSPPSDQTRSVETRRQLYRQLLDRAASIPGVEGASGAVSGLLSSETWRNVITIEGVQPPNGQTLRSAVNAVTPAYFDVMRIAVRRGRSFSDDDRSAAPRVAIVNEAFARRFMAGQAAVGRRVGLCTGEACEAATATMMEVVGLVQDAKYTNVWEAAPPIVYIPFMQGQRRLAEIQVRTAGDPSAIAPALYRALADVDSRFAVTGMMTARDRVDTSLATPNLVARASSAFGLLALSLAAVGLSGLVAFMTTQRTREIGIRMALGADPGNVRRLVLTHTVRLVALGAAIGLPAALALGQLLSGLLYQVGPHDPVVFGLSLGVLAGVALLAGYLPARRAARANPIDALRYE